MSLRRLHRRLAVLMGLAGLTAFAGGAGLEPVSAGLAAAALLAALFWQPGPELSSRLERVWVPIAVILVVRALYHVLVVGDDVVVPVVDLLLLLLAAESLRSLDTPNGGRIYALSFALLLASAAYRPGVLFAIAVLAYLVLATVALFVGHLQREAERNGIEEIPLRRPLLARIAALAGVVLLAAIAVFLTFPRVSRGWTARGETAGAASIVGFSDVISLGEFGATIRSNPSVVLRVEFPDGPPPNPTGLYWRGRSYDRFDGIRWSRSRDLPPALAPQDWYEGWGEGRVTQEIFAAPIEDRILFALHPLLDVDARSPVRGFFDNAGDFAYRGSAGPVYRAVSVASRPSPDELRRAEGRFTPAPDHYTQLPRLPERIGSLADSLAEGRATRYDRVVAVEEWLQGDFAYTLELPRTAREATLDHFLFERRAGHCEYFSSAMVVLLRSLEIPARNVNGFLGGRWSELGRYLAVTQNEAHSWVEVWFADYGWVPFDPTPAGGGGAEARTVGFWPGRFLLDAVQHRWGKWVLDYSVETQWSLLDRISSLLGTREEPDGSAGGGGGARGIPWPAWLAGAVGGLLLAWWAVARWRRGVSPESRAFLRLRRSVDRAGFSGAERASPLDLVRRLRDAAHPAAEPADELVRHYLEVRFGGVALTEAGRSAMKGALGRARRALRRREPTPDRRGASGAE